MSDGLGTITVDSSVIAAIKNAPSGGAILDTCIDIAVFLAGKNTAYGNAAFEPLNVFTKTDAEEQAKMAIDNKLNRLLHGNEYAGDDTVMDLLGYLIILKTIQNIKKDETQPVEIGDDFNV